jgi:biopolymer transport protein ExbD
MLEVFDALAATGSNNPRSMAAGVSKATVSTLAGMVVAIVGLLALSLSERRAVDAREKLPVHFPQMAPGAACPQEETPVRNFLSDLNIDSDESTVDITPMLDVVFIMLIFFIVTATFIKEAGIDVDKPEAATAVVQEKASILIAIDAEDRVWINRRQVDLRSVRSIIERLHAENPKGTVVIQADRASRNDTLVRVMDSSRRAGVYDIALAAN